RSVFAGRDAERAFPCLRMNDRQRHAEADQDAADLAIDLKEDAGRVGGLLWHRLRLLDEGVTGPPLFDQPAKGMAVEIVALGFAASDAEGTGTSSTARSRRVSASKKARAPERPGSIPAINTAASRTDGALGCRLASSQSALREPLSWPLRHRKLVEAV